jgi:hypothetical protein
LMVFSHICWIWHLKSHQKQSQEYDINGSIRWEWISVVQICEIVRKKVGSLAWRPVLEHAISIWI